MPPASPQSGGGKKISILNTNYTISAEEFSSIEQYLLDETNAEQKQAFENKMSQDVVLTSKVNEVKLLLAGIERASLKDRLDSYHVSIKKNQPQKSGGKIVPLKRKWLVAASVALLAALSVWLYSSRGDKYEQLYATYFKPDPGLMIAMGIGDNYLFNKAMVDYKTGNYKKAIVEWSKLKTSTDNNDTLNYFLGAAQQADGNSAAAIVLLQSMASDAAKPFYKDACWYTGLALLKQGKANEAIPYLEKSGRAESSELISQLK